MLSRPPDTASTSGPPVLASATSCAARRMSEDESSSIGNAWVGTSHESPAYTVPSTSGGRIRATDVRPFQRGGAWTTLRANPELRDRSQSVEEHGTMGTVWASLGMTAYYMALIWINILLGLFLSPLFMIPATWVQDRFRNRKTARMDTSRTANTRV